MLSRVPVLSPFDRQRTRCQRSPDGEAVAVVAWFVNLQLSVERSLGTQRCQISKEV